ncbi:MAG: bifunctional diguanylate cyclase/phosphodiesterase [Gammaproteobacteria bacterium]
MHDPLTGLHRRESFFVELERHVSRCNGAEKRVGLITVDIQRFRDINSAFGYRTADSLLEAFAQRIHAMLRPADVFGRVSGDEFALLLPGIASEGHATLAAHKVIEALSSPFCVDGHTLQLRVTMGIALYPHHGTDPEQLLQSADAALSWAKRSNLPLVVFSEECRSAPGGPLLLENDLRSAIENDELEVYFQPKVQLSDGLACGAEALARWSHPTRGFVPPDTFIPIAERTGLIAPLTFWSLNAALMQCSNCRKKWDRLSVAVNLSPCVLHDPDVVELVTRAMRIWGTDPGLLTLEITEGAMMADPARSLQTLQQLHDLGVVISIDDFGTGYSSLAYLKKLPVRELKIDKSFVRNMADDKDDAKIVRSIIDLAHNFELQVIAEGVENQATLERLRDMGCDYAQGFYIAEPMPPDSVTRWMFESRFSPGRGETFAP